MRPPVRGGRRLTVLVAATVAVGGIAVAAPVALAADGPDPARVGVWSAPFEEGGVDSPRCPAQAAEALQGLGCKPAAAMMAVLPDGRVLYGSSDKDGGSGDAPANSREDRTRTLDVRGAQPGWHVPERSADAPELVSGRPGAGCLTGSPTAVAGVPGRGGDGLVGSLVGQTGTETEPSCAPADAHRDVFSGDIVQLADGRQLLVGGSDDYVEPGLSGKGSGGPIPLGVPEGTGLRGARVFDSKAGADGQGRWEPVAPMKFGRYHPAATTLADGTVAVVSGTTRLVKNTQLSQVRRVETYDPKTNKWTERYSGLSSERSLPQDPRVFLAPNGKLFYTGDGQMLGRGGVAADEAQFAQQGFFDPATNEWSSAGFTIPRSSPASVALPMKAPYDSMTILRAGGTLGPPPGSYAAVPTTDLTTIKADGSVVNLAGPELRSARWFSQATPLPTGEVLLTSGARNDEVALPGGALPVKQPELYSPDTNKFVQLAQPEHTRTYHNSAVLLPNGQVLVGGNAPADLGYGPSSQVVPGVTANPEDDPSFEVYSPPYLFHGYRPHIDDVQAGLAWGQNFPLISDDAADIQNVMLMRLPAAQDVMDNDTRTLELPFAQTGSRSLAVEMPRDGVAAPPGYYYLFVNRTVSGQNKALVPSVARIVKVGPTVNKASAVEPMSDNSLIGVDAATLARVGAKPPAPAKAPAPAKSGDAPAGGVLPGVPAVPSPDSAAVPGAPSVPSPDAATVPQAPADPTGNLPIGNGVPSATLPTLPTGGAGRRGKRRGR